MDDLEAIRLFVRDGGVAGEWHAVDQHVRNHYEKLALEKTEPGSLLSQRPAPAVLDARRPQQTVSPARVPDLSLDVCCRQVVVEP